jgi:hypothetical protein
LPVFLGLLGKRVRDAWRGEQSIVADGLLDEKLSGITYWGGYMLRLLIMDDDW